MGCVSDNIAYLQVKFSSPSSSRLPINTRNNIVRTTMEAFIFFSASGGLKGLESISSKNMTKRAQSPLSSPITSCRRNNTKKTTLKIAQVSAKPGFFSL